MLVSIGKEFRLRLFDLAELLMRFAHISSLIEHTNHSII
jgi:hypothetical protein